ncbi:MAG: extracellular solute-binding protein [Lachnospiraceae bacterium]|nr:extracellular solute-binding protein [Lachnospiraceae bacterium]
MCILVKQIKLICIFLLPGMLLTGCGDSLQPALDTQEQEAVNESAIYHLTEQLLPDSQAAVPEEFWLEDNWILREEESFFLNDNWYLLSWFYIKGHGSVGTCVQTLNSSLDSWVSYGFPDQEMEEYTGGGVEKASLAGADEEGFFLEISFSGKEEHLLGHYGWDDTWESLLEIPESLNDAIWYRTEDGLWAASGGNRIMTAFDRDYQEQDSRSLSGKVVGVLENPADNTFCWYGFERNELVLWDGETGQISRRLTDQINPYGDFCMAYSSTGELLLADTERAWLYGVEEQDPRELFSFMKLEYPLDTIYGCSFREDGALQFWASCDGEKYLLTAEVSDPAAVSEKQEITIASTVVGYAMEKLVARYNRQSESYHVTFVMPEKEEEWADFRRRIQLEMTAGRGPDLLRSFMIDMRETADQGYLEPLDWVVEDMSPFHESVFQTGQIEGVLYGIPYSCHPRFLMVSGQITDQSTWTLEEMMEAVRNSSAEILEYNRSGVEIVMYYGLYDEENKTLIDWEAGESHLTEEPFLELLAFAREYADTGEYTAEDLMNRLRDGTIAGVNPDLQGPGDLNKLKSCFNGDGVVVGYPRVSGSGIYMSADMLCMNHNAANKDGATDFLLYLLSEEGQRKYAEYGGWDSLSVRRSVNEYCLEKYQQGVKDPPDQRWTSGGFSWEETALDEEQIEQYWRILDTAASGSVLAEDLWTIVEEELEPYFSGDRSAEEAAAVLDSRVQLYLDERK